VAVVNLDDAGDTAAAAALCMLIVLGSLAGRGILDAARVVAARRMEGWRQR
jgi:iron(III) transport system permease protein